MNLLLYIYIFLIGITFGSFFTLAVYRIPRGEDITHTRSYCPKCNHKLSFWDMIPLFSYIFLGAKCRYCKEKIRPRYFILEFCSGLVFVLFALSIKLNIYTLTAQTIIYFIFGLLYIAGLFIVSGIDKEKINIQNEVTLYLTIVEAVYIIYLCIVDSASIYRYVIYLLTLVILTMANTIYYKKKVKNNYTLDCLILLNIMLIFTYECCSILTVIFTLLAMSIKVLIDKINNEIEKDYNTHSAVTHYIDEYGFVPPFVLMKIFTFGVASSYCGLLKQSDRQAIAKYFKISDKLLKQILKNLTTIRNVAAHSERLYIYTSKFYLSFKLIDMTYVKLDNITNLYMVIRCMRKLLTRFNYRN